MKIQRRTFVKMLAAGIPGYFVSRAHQGMAADIWQEDKPVIYRTLGKTGIRVPIISSGIVPQDNLRLCRSIFRSGILLFDSAYLYQNGRNSAVLGQMIKEFGRDAFTITTKVYLPVNEETRLFTEAATEAEFFSQLDAELKRLDLPSVDILMIHKPACRANVLNKEVIGWLQKAKEQGKTRFIGTSNHGHVAECLDAMVEAGVYDIALVTVNYQQDADVEPALARAADAGLGIIAMKVHAGTFLDKERTLPVDKAAATKWALQNEHVHTAVISMRSYEDFELHTALMHDITMTDAEHKHLKSFTYKAEYASLFCHSCHACVAQCPKKLPIPDTMRAYMYTYGYNDVLKAANTLNKLSLADDPCKDCDTCVVKCPHNLPVRERLADMAVLKTNPMTYCV